MFLDQLPRNPSGKVLKRELAEDPPLGHELNRPRPTGSSARSGCAATSGTLRGRPPPSDLEVECTLPRATSGCRDVRMVVVYCHSEPRHPRRLAGVGGPRRGRTFSPPPPKGPSTASSSLGPTYVKLGQIIASSPGCSPSRWPGGPALPRRSAALRGRTAER